MSSAFFRALTGVAAAFNEPMAKDRLEAYWAILQPYGADACVQALVQAARNETYFPRPATIIGYITGDCGNPEHEANLAWAQVCRSASSARDLSRLCCDDDRIATAIDALGGWWGLNNSGEERKWQAKRFVATFIGAHERRRADRQQEAISSGEVAKLIEQTTKQLGKRSG